MKAYERILLDNKAWAEEKVLLDENFFKRLAKIQKPEFLWIGCSDSRVPANEITDTQPGEIFVHRNIANLVVPNDLNLLSVIEYSVLVLKVKHIIVCGHYGCGGIKASMSHQGLHSIDQWLKNIPFEANRAALEAIPDIDARADRLTELSVEYQVEKLSQLPTIRKAWEEMRQPILHGWVYRLVDGILHPICKKVPEGVSV
jgi:carbonic anhydrase